jgi:flavorubredoxin
MDAHASRDGVSTRASRWRQPVASIDEIAPDVFRISHYAEPAGLAFNQFLVRDDDPLLYHTLQNARFDESLAAVASLIDVGTLRWIGFSHFESDECGSLNRWLAKAPRATPLAGVVAAATCINDFAARAPRVLEDNAEFATGSHRLRFLVTPYVPHSWESTLLYDTTQQVLFCSDLVLQRGRTPAVSGDVLEAALDAAATGQRGPFHDSMPWTRHTAPTLARLADLHPRVLAIMHGAAFAGDAGALLHAYADGLQRILGQPANP